MLKRKYRKSAIGCLDDIAKVVHSSSDTNVAQLVGKLDGTVVVPTYNWSDFFDIITKKTAMKGIKKLQHFRFTTDHPGVVLVKSACDESDHPLKGQGLQSFLFLSTFNCTTRP